MLELIESTVAAGGRMFGMTHSRGISVLLSFKTKLPFDVLPEWQPVRALPVEQQKHALRDPVAVMRRIRAMMRSGNALV